MQPDLVAIKETGATGSHAWYDSTRGVQKRIEPDGTSAEATSDDGVTAFGTNGFTVGTLAQINNSGDSFNSWSWKKGATPGFDIVSYAGDNTSNRNVNHSLGVAPEFVIVKGRGATGWFVYHKNLSATTDFLRLEDALTVTTTNSPWGTANWSATQFMISNNATNNANAAATNYIAYLWASVPGFSKFASYTANGVADGRRIELGFRPMIVLIRMRGAGGWQLFTDNYSDYNNVSQSVALDTTSTPATNGSVDFLANGFKLRDANGNTNSGSNVYLYAAWARTPVKYSNPR